MDVIREDFLREMLKTGRAYPHEVKSIADELLRLRKPAADGYDPVQYIKVYIPRKIFYEATYTNFTDARTLEIGQARLITKDGGHQFVTYRIA